MMDTKMQTRTAWSEISETAVWGLDLLLTLAYVKAWVEIVKGGLGNVYLMWGIETRRGLF